MLNLLSSISFWYACDIIFILLWRIGTKKLLPARVTKRASDFSNGYCSTSHIQFNITYINVLISSENPLTLKYKIIIMSRSVVYINIL